LAKELSKNPLPHTEVSLVITGCEEVGAYGMAAYLEQHAAQLGPETVYIILDQVGAGRIKFLTADGLLIKHKTHRDALRLAREIVKARPELDAYEGVGIAYTDALHATKRGLKALTLCTMPVKGTTGSAHWHQMSDTLEHVIPADLDKVFAFTKEIFTSVDRSSG